MSDANPGYLHETERQLFGSWMREHEADAALEAEQDAEYDRLLENFQIDGLLAELAGRMTRRASDAAIAIITAHLQSVAAERVSARISAAQEEPPDVDF